MRKIKFQIVGHKDHEPLSPIYECEIDPVSLPNSRTIYLIEKDASIIRIGDIVMKPLRIHLDEQQLGALVFVEPEGTGWSRTPYFETVRIISISED